MEGERFLSSILKFLILTVNMDTFNSRLLRLFSSMVYYQCSRVENDAVLKLIMLETNRIFVCSRIDVQNVQLICIISEHFGSPECSIEFF